MTYNGMAYVGINIDTRAIPDPEVFVEHIRAAFDEVLAIADPDARAVRGPALRDARDRARSAPARRGRRGEASAGEEGRAGRRRPRRRGPPTEEGPRRRRLTVASGGACWPVARRAVLALRRVRHRGVAVG